MYCFLWLIFERNQLFKGVALTQHRDVSKIRFESYPDITGRFAVPDQLEFRLDNRGNKDAHGVTVGYFPCREVSGPSSSSGGSVLPVTMSYRCFPSSILHLKHHCL